MKLFSRSGIYIPIIHSGKTYAGSSLPSSKRFRGLHLQILEELEKGFEKTKRKDFDGILI
jgi:hypothetical protein